MIPTKFLPLDYKQCTKSVMDNISDPNITFDAEGISNYYYQYQKFASEERFTPENKKTGLERVIAEMKEAGKGKKYDCLLGLSGGADSSYMAWIAKEHGLRPLVVHFDYGWNTDLATSNIENVTKKLGFELYTYVIDWPIIRDLQRSYYKASVIDLDVPADHTIFGSIFQIAKKMDIKHLLNGTNYQTELIMPKGWNYLKTDLVNIKNIHKKFGELPLKGVPTNGVLDQIKYRLHGIVGIPLLYYVDYNQKDVVELLQRELGWRNYEGKHFENIFTRFYQGVVLPNKFGVDKRKPHLSNMIFSGQITREEALVELSKPTYDLNLQEEDKDYIAKKLGFSTDEFEIILNQENVAHEFYGTDAALRQRIYNWTSWFLPHKYKMMVKEKVLRDLNG